VLGPVDVVHAWQTEPRCKNLIPDRLAQRGQAQNRSARQRSGSRQGTLKHLDRAFRNQSCFPCVVPLQAQQQVLQLAAPHRSGAGMDGHPLAPKAARRWPATELERLGTC